jgi:hypothetical protein
MTSTPGSPVSLPIPALAPLPLTKCIRDVPFPLPLAERLDMSIPVPEPPSTPSPSEELHYPPLIPSGMITPMFSEESSYSSQPMRDSAKPDNYMIYNHHLENHVKYGKKIHLPTSKYKYPHYIHFDHNYVNHCHHIFATRKDVEGIPYGWTLEAAPFIRPHPSPLIADSDHLSPFTYTYHFKKEVDIVLYTIDNSGLIADVDRHRALEEEHQLAHRHRELENDTFDLSQKLRPVHQHLCNTQAYPCIHPYLAGTTKVPLPYSACPASHHDYPLTMKEALTIDSDVSWLPHPWYHKETQAGSTPMPLTNHSICVYCNDITHSPAACPDPHRLCPNCYDSDGKDP